MADSYQDWINYQEEDVLRRMKEEGMGEILAMVQEAQGKPDFLGNLVLCWMNSLHDCYVDEAGE